jgi:hypothetical protein
LLLRSNLLHFFSDRTTALSILILALATNLYHYSIQETGSAHTHNFFLASAAIYLAIRWTKEKYFWRAVLFGFICGLIVLVRPINILLLLPLPFFSSYFQNSLEANKTMKTQLLDGLRLFIFSRQMLVAFIAAILITLPQLLFWKIQSGSWVYYSYSDEGFFFLQPNILKGLFSFRKGWFIYTPIMFLSVLGLIHLSKQNQWLGKSISFTFLIFLYVTFSWWCWWYGGGFSARTLIDFYPFLAFSLTALLSVLLARKIWVKLISAVLIFSAIQLNLFQSTQYLTSLLHWDSMTYKAYKAIFLEEKFPPNYSDLIEQPNYDKQKATGCE